MKKLNNKGMTAVEVLVCFVMVVIITVSMYTMVSSYKNKQEIEAIKEKILTYKNLLTKEINDDLIKNGIISAEVKTVGADSDEFEVTMTLRNGDKKRLKVKRVMAFDYLLDPEDSGSPDRSESKDDEFMISYGDYGDETNYPIPDVGSSENLYGNKIYDLRINNVDINTNDSILTIYVGFYHPELGTRYAIDIVCPINFGFTSTSVMSDAVSVPTAMLRETGSSGTILSNDGSWKNKTLWLGEFSSFSTNGIDHYEISEGCTGTGVVANESYTFSTNTDSKFCIRAIDNYGKESDWSEAYYIKVDKDPPKVKVAYARPFIVGTCYAKENGLGVTYENCYLGSIAFRPDASDSLSGITTKNFSCSTTVDGSSWPLSASESNGNVYITPNISKDRLSVAKVTCTLTASDLAGNINSTNHNFTYGNGWEQIPTSSGIDDWKYLSEGSYLNGWQKLYWYNSNNPSGDFLWYYFYTGTETTTNNYCDGIGKNNYMARGWCREIGGYSGYYYLISPNDTIVWPSSMGWFADGSMLSDVTISINSSDYTFDSSGRCIAGNGCY